MKTITSTNLRKLLYAAFGVECKCQDADYAIPSSHWMLNKFFPWHEDVLDIVKADKWKTNHDCDNKAIGLMWMAGVCHGQHDSDVPQGVAIGMIEYLTDDAGWHAINIAIVDDVEIKFIEPQTSQFVELSKSEKLSIRYILF